MTDHLSTTADREQIRRDATEIDMYGPRFAGEKARKVAAACLALLDELEQADDWLIPFLADPVEWHESLPSPYTYQRSDFGALVAAVHAYEARALSAEARLPKAETLANSIRALTADPAVPEGTWKDAGRAALKAWDDA